MKRFTLDNFIKFITVNVLIFHIRIVCAVSKMPHKGFTTVTIPLTEYEDMKRFLEENEEKLRRKHITKVSHLVLEAWYQLRSEPVNIRLPKVMVDAIDRIVDLYADFGWNRQLLIESAIRDKMMKVKELEGDGTFLTSSNLKPSKC